MNKVLPKIAAELKSFLHRVRRPRSREEKIILGIKLLLAFIGLAIIAVGVMVTTWYLLAYSHPKLITGINYYRFPIRIVHHDAEFVLQTFDTYSITTESVGRQEVFAYNMDGELLGSRSFTTTNAPGIGIDFWSEPETVELCPALLDVTEVYYEPVANVIQPRPYLIKRLSDKPQKGIYMEYSSLDYSSIYLSVGGYATNSTNLPQELYRGQMVKGLYVLECDSLNNPDALLEEVNWWRLFDAQTQRELLQQKLEEVNNTPEYLL